MSDEELRKLSQRVVFERLASNTVASHDELMNRVRRARENGWSASVSETVDGASAVAAPVKDHQGATVGTLSLYAPADRFD